jgi:hypothetical protein
MGVDDAVRTAWLSGLKHQLKQAPSPTLNYCAEPNTGAGGPCYYCRPGG